MDPNESPKLGMAPAETSEDLARRFERERRAVSRQIEAGLCGALHPFRVGSVPYLNAAPLTRGLEEEIVFVTPSQLAEQIRRDELDAALVSVTEVLFHDRYDILDGISVSSLGEVVSVFLAHQDPIEEIQEIHCDPASLTSVALLRVLLAERGLHPKFPILPGYQLEPMPRNLLLIGDPGIDFLRAGHPHQVWDLGAAWFESTGLPFVYAVWALRRGIENQDLRRRLREAKNFGMETLEAIILNRPEYDYNFRKDYLGWHIHYHLASDEKRGLAKFIELLRKHGVGPVYEPRFVM
jgi:chorismate dehydratase